MKNNMILNPVKALRLQLGMTQKQLGTRIGLSQNSINYYESWQTFPRKKNLVKLIQIAEKNKLIFDAREYFNKYNEVVFHRKLPH